MSPRRRSGLIGLLLAAAPGTCLGQGLYFEGGLSLARGDYVYSQQMSSGGAAAGLAWTGGRLTVRATLPYFVRDTSVLPASAEVPAESQPEPVPGGHEGSISDPLLQVYGQVYQSRRSAVGLSASLKVPVVAAGDFGTGEWDLGGGLSLSHFVGTATMLGVDLSYWHLGDMPELPLQDAVMATLSLGHSLGRSWLASASLSGGRSTLAGYEDPWWASVLVSHAGRRGLLGVTASVGLTSTAPDVTVGVVWRVRLGPGGTSSGATTSSPRASAPPAPGS